MTSLFNNITGSDLEYMGIGSVLTIFGGLVGLCLTQICYKCCCK